MNVIRQPAPYVIVDRDNSLVASCDTVAAGKRFARWQGMSHRWTVKLRADWKGK